MTDLSGSSVQAPAVLLGIGMMTSVGLTAPETASSVRAGISRFTELDLINLAFEPHVLALACDEGLPELAADVEEEQGLTSREIRLLRLASYPILEAMAPILPLDATPGLLLALPEAESNEAIDAETFLRRLAVQTGNAIDVARSCTVGAGRAAGLIALREAVNRIREGKDDWLLVAGVDTYRDIEVLDRLDREGRIKSSNNLDGFIPGEGAGVLLLGGLDRANKESLQPLASLSDVSEAYEPGHLYSDEPYLGEGLAQAFTDLLKRGRITSSLQDVYSSMNGENHWAKEWGVSLIRNRKAFTDDVRIHHPADCFGEVGASCGPIMIGLAAIGVKRRSHVAPCAVYCSSDRGQRAAVLVS